MIYIISGIIILIAIIYLIGELRIDADAEELD